MSTSKAQESRGQGQSLKKGQRVLREVLEVIRGVSQTLG